MKKRNQNALPAKKRGFTRSLLAIPYGVYMVIFIVLPLLILLLFAFSKTNSIGELTFEFTLDHFIKAFNETNRQVFLRSVWVGLATTGICFGLGYPAAYFLATKRYNRSPILVLLFILPMWTNLLLRTLATKSLFNFLDVQFGYGTVLFGMIYNFLPFMILPIYTSILKIDPSLIEAANDLGASELTAFTKVVFPLSIPGIMSGFMMVFIPSITTFVISDMLSNYNIALIGNFIEGQIGSMQYGVASAISFILILFIVIIMLFVNRYDKDRTAAGGGLW